LSQATLLDPRQFLARKSFIELNARERAQALMDQGTFRELLGPFDRLESPWLPMQGVVPQADDGVIVARGRIGGKDSVILAIEGKFQGGSAGEVSGAKMTATLDLAHRDATRGRPVQVVLLLETGGVRLQEANLGLEAIAEINSSLVALRQHVPVIGVIAGMLGCFGGMSITASLCSYLIMTREARLGLNGKLGTLYKLIDGVNVDSPDAKQVEQVRADLLAAIADARSGQRDLSSRLQSEGARKHRRATLEVRRRLAEQWNAG
jgi:malonate decarboxylase beta subunit